MNLKRYPKSQLKKYYAKQMLLEPLTSQSEPHSIPRCMACDDAKELEFRQSGDGQPYYKCHHCGFESEPMGFAPAWLK
jgi:hypothetical protein